MTNTVLQIFDIKNVMSVNNPPDGFSKIWPDTLTNNFKLQFSDGTIKKILNNIETESIFTIDTPVSTENIGRLILNVGMGLSKSGTELIVSGLTAASIGSTNVYQNGYILSATASGEFFWIPNSHGSGDANFVAKFLAPNTIGNSIIVSSGSNVWIGSAPVNTSATFSVSGTGNFNRVNFSDNQNRFIDGSSDIMNLSTTGQFSVNLNGAATSSIISFLPNSQFGTMSLLNGTIIFGNTPSSTFVTTGSITSTQLILSGLSNTNLGTSGSSLILNRGGENILQSSIDLLSLNSGATGSDFQIFTRNESVIGITGPTSSRSFTSERINTYVFGNGTNGLSASTLFRVNTNQLNIRSGVSDYVSLTPNLGTFNSALRFSAYSTASSSRILSISSNGDLQANFSSGSLGIFSQTASGGQITAASTSSPFSIVGNGVDFIGRNIPPGFYTLGTVVRTKTFGRFSTRSLHGDVDATIRLMIGGVTASTISITLAQNISNNHFRLETEIVAINSNTLMTHMVFMNLGESSGLNTPSVAYSSTSNTTFNLSVTQSHDITWQWSASDIENNVVGLSNVWSYES